MSILRRCILSSGFSIQLGIWQTGMALTTQVGQCKFGKLPYRAKCKDVLAYPGKESKCLALREFINIMSDWSSLGFAHRMFYLMIQCVMIMLWWGTSWFNILTPYWITGVLLIQTITPFLDCSTKHRNILETLTLRYPLTCTCYLRSNLQGTEKLHKDLAT